MSKYFTKFQLGRPTKENPNGCDCNTDTYISEPKSQWKTKTLPNFRTFITASVFLTY